ncbi:MAG: hypothetical protein GEV06_05735 [Luteitalea sp.]|nr:hypothetical protein [Luteitalea sp.]
MSIRDSWVHGNSVLLERVGAPNARSKRTVRNALRNNVNIDATGDIIHLGGHGAAACFRIGWASRFVIFDSGTEDQQKSGNFWCHFAIPTAIALNAGRRTVARELFINYETTDKDRLDIRATHIWDGNRRIFANNRFVAPRLGADGGIRGHTTNANSTPTTAPTRLSTQRLVPREIYFGVTVSLLIAAVSARGDFLEIRSVGVRFEDPSNVGITTTVVGDLSTIRKTAVKKSGR